MSSLEEARELVSKNKGDGVNCPCCDQFAKEYKRKLNSTMARGLIWLVSEFIKTTEWIHVNDNAPRYLIKGGDFAKLLHWGLIIRKPNSDPKKKSSGYYMPTTNGIGFARSLNDVPEYIYIYNCNVQGFGESKISIVEALGQHFNYLDLIESHPVYTAANERHRPASLRHQAV